MAREISLQEVQKHKTEKDVWVVVNNDVLDVTAYINEHPGGVEAIMEMAGTDATQAFEDVGHSSDAREIAAKFKIGRLPESEAATPKTSSCGCPVTAAKYALLALAAAVVVAVVYKKFAS